MKAHYGVNKATFETARTSKRWVTLVLMEFEELEDTSCSLLRLDVPELLLLLLLEEGDIKLKGLAAA